MNVPLPLSPITQEIEGTLVLINAKPEIPCHLYAMHALQVAIETKRRWIRVEKPGHACELDVHRLVRHCQEHAATVPRAVIYTKSEHQAVGNWSDEGRPLWSGVNLEGRASVSGDGFEPRREVLTAPGVAP